MSPENLLEENSKLRCEVAALKEEIARLRCDSGQDRGEDDELIGRLQLMVDAAGQIAKTLDLNQVLQTIMTDAKRVMNAEASSLLLVDEATGDLVFSVALGEKGEEVKSIRVKRGQGIAGWVAENGKTLLVPDVDKDPRFARAVSQSVGFQTKSILCSPLREGSHIIGVVQVLNKMGPDGPAFGEEDVKFFEGLADQSATAVSQAQLFRNTIGSFSSTLDARDPYTQGHSERVTDFAVAIAEQVGLSSDELHDLRLAGLLHDVGKIGVRDSVLLKPGKLDDEEYELMKKHPVIGYNIFKPIRQLRRSLDGIRHHHERMDGRGYPDGLKGDEIPLQGRILAVADCFDAMTSTRAYRSRMETSRAFQLMGESKGAQHDPPLLDALVAAYDLGKVLEQARRPQPTPTLDSAPPSGQ